VVKKWMIFLEIHPKPPHPILQWLRMNDHRRFLLSAGILILMISLAVLPPVMAGFVDLSQADALASSDPGQAALEYESASRLLPWRTDLREKAGLAALADENPALALQILEQSPKLTPTGRLALGDAHYRSGNVQSALEIWEQLREDGLGSTQVYNRLGHVYYQQGRYDDAIETFRIATRLDALDSDSQYMLGLLLAAQSPQDALSVLIRAAQLDPKLDSTIQGLRRGLNLALLSSSKAAQLTGAGRALVAARAWTLAKEAFINAAETDSHYAPAWAWLGYVNQVLDAGGLIELNQALELDPNSAEIRGLRAVFFMRENRFEEAQVEFEEAARLEPLSPGWQVALGDVVARTGNVPQGLAYFQRAIELSPRSADYWRALANFTVDYNYGVQETGLPAALQARALAPDDPQSSVTLGRVYFAINDLTMAEKLWLDVLEANPDIPAVHLYLGVLFLQKDQSESAYLHLEQAMTLDPGGPYGAQAARMLAQYFP
jgi:tetratricopeptide (TPR) repeat protein